MRSCRCVRPDSSVRLLGVGEGWAPSILAQPAGLRRAALSACAGHTYVAATAAVVGRCASPRACPTHWLQEVMELELAIQLELETFGDYMRRVAIVSLIVVVFFVYPSICEVGCFVAAGCHYCGGNMARPACSDPSLHVGHSIDAAHKNDDASGICVAQAALSAFSCYSVDAHVSASATNPYRDFAKARL